MSRRLATSKSLSGKLVGPRICARPLIQQLLRAFASSAQGLAEASISVKRPQTHPWNSASSEPTATIISLRFNSDTQSKQTKAQLPLRPLN